MGNFSLAEILHNSKYLVCLTGREMIVEDGIDSMRDMKTAYEIELKYGYSPEEVFSAQFFSTRPEQFYKFYRDEVLAQVKEPGKAYYALAALEKMGILKCTITRQLFNLVKRAGCQNVYNLHGNIYDNNHCPRCGRIYSIDYMKKGKIPLCEKCGIPIHPGVILLGEMVEIGLTTRAADEVSKADTLLILGSDMRTEMVQQFIKYFQGERVVLINAGPHFADQEADYCLYGKIADILTAAVEELQGKPEYLRQEEVKEEAAKGPSAQRPEDADAEDHQRS